jgi:hypothetical protein
VSANRQFTEEPQNAGWKRQQEREAQERERIRKAVATSELPLPAEIVQAVIYLPDEHSRGILQEHPGFALAERRSSYLTSLSVLELCLADLLSAIDNFEVEATAESSDLFSRINGAPLEAIERRIQKELFSSANAAASLVDHARRVRKCIEIPSYDDQLRASFGTDGLHDFVIGLRVLLHHLHIVEAGWQMRTKYSEGTKSATFMIRKATVLRAIAQFPERFGGEKSGSLLAYVNGTADSIDLRVIFEDYRARIARFHGWLREQLASSSLVALRDYDRCMLEKKNLGVRTWWNMLLGNWLRNWKVPPNPHDHLQKYLTPEQRAEVYKLPRNSKAQVDLVIKYMDTDQAINDNLRKLAYELFERSPPLDSRSTLESA